MADIFNDQKKFMKACDQTVDTYNKDQFKLYTDLIDEEVKELHEAVEAEDKVEQLDALIDILVVTAGALHSLGVDADGAWKEVMGTNFAKIDKWSGKVKKREDGKVLKPDGWQAPKLGNYIRKF